MAPKKGAPKAIAAPHDVPKPISRLITDKRPASEIDANESGPSGPSKIKREKPSLDRATVSRVLTGLKYRAKGSGAGKDDAAAALEACCHE